MPVLGVSAMCPQKRPWRAPTSQSVRKLELGRLQGPAEPPSSGSLWPRLWWGQSEQWPGDRAAKLLLLPTPPPPSLWVSRLPLAAPGAFGVPWPGRGQEGVSHVASEGDAHSE